MPTIPALVSDWFAANARDLPWRREGFTAWGTLVSEIMLQQTPVARVIPTLEAWLERWPTPGALAAASAGDAVREWGRLGYPRRALNLHAAAVAISDRHGGVVPEDLPSLLALPGVGDYTARAVAAFAYGRRHPVVDINVRRVIARAVNGSAQPGPASRGDLTAMEALLPQDAVAARACNASMMELGAVLCTARSPRCTECPIRSACRWRAEGYPAFAGRAAPRQKRFDGSDRQVRGMVLARLRGSDQPVSEADVATPWPDAAQRERAISSLLADGLIVRGASGLSLPL